MKPTNSREVGPSSGPENDLPAIARLGEVTYLEGDLLI